jgi:hypothetical protein
MSRIKDVAAEFAQLQREYRFMEQVCKVGRCREAVRTSRAAAASC